MSAVRIPIWSNNCQKPYWGKTPRLIWIHLYNLLKASKEQDCIKQSHDKDPQEFTRLCTINVNSPHLRLLFFFQPMLMTICWVLVVSGNVWSVDTSPAGQMSGIISRQSMLDPRVTIALCVLWFWKIGLLSGIIFPDLTNTPLDWFLICVPLDWFVFTVFRKHWVSDGQEWRRAVAMSELWLLVKQKVQCQVSRGGQAHDAIWIPLSPLP